MTDKILKAILFYIKNSLKIKLFKYNIYHLYSFGWVALFTHPTFWFIWSFLDPMVESIELRTIGFISSIILLLFIYNIKYSICRKILPYYWILMLSYNLPFFFTTNLLRNEFIDNWLMAEIIMIFVTTIFVPNILYSFIIIIFNGLLSILFVKLILNYQINYPLNLFLHHLPLYLLGFVSAHIFSYASIVGVALEQKNNSLRSLAGSIAHEMRNPLSAIKLSTQNLDKIPKEDEIMDFKRQITKTIDLASKVIDMTLHELGGKKFEEEDFSYHSAYKSIIDAVTIYGYQSNEHKEKVIIDLGNRQINASKADRENLLISDFDKNHDFLIHIEDNAFKYVIFNLVKNALFYLKDYPDSNITINFERGKAINADLVKRFKLDPTIDLYNVINVTDTGPGIADDIISKIFDSYFTSGKKGGTGVGLDFCGRMMDEFNGAIICQSEIGKYTTFSLLFPMIDADVEDKAIADLLQIEKKKEEALESGKDIADIERSLVKKPQKNILLVDDVKINIEVLSKDLKEKCPNFAMTIINDSTEAFKLVKEKQKSQQQFDLILTDIEMPIMDGIALTRRIRQELNLSKDDFPILAYSSREKQEIIDQAITAGVNHYYTKPKDLRFIARNISKWLLNDYFPSKNIYHQEIIVNADLLKDLNIIIADDQMINLMTLARKFQDHGANVTKCKDGSEIIDLIKKDVTKYHLILTDINMEEIGGIQASQEVRKIEAEYNKNKTQEDRYKIPIIAISGDNDKKFVMEMLNNSIDDYLVKGCNGEDMIKLSKFWIDYYHPNQSSDNSITDIKSNNDNITKITSNAILSSDFGDLFTNKEEFKELITIFEIESNKIIEEIIAGKSEIEPLRKAIHKIKGSSGSIGALKLFEYTSKINASLQQGKMPTDTTFDQKIQKLFQEALTEMKKYQ